MTETWDLLLRGAVAAVLLFHVIQLLGPGPRHATRVALAILALSLIAYLFCQRTALLAQLPRPVMWAALALCASATAWLWLAARALFDDRFAWRWPYVAAGIGMVGLGLAANAPRLDAILAGGADPGPSSSTTVHTLAMVAVTAAALWEVLRGWHDDLVEPRRAVRRWAALGIGLYAVVALAVELAVRDRPVGPVLPALHVLGIGIVAMALAVVVARRSLDVILGQPPSAVVDEQARRADLPSVADASSAAGAPSVADVSVARATRAAETSPALQRLLQAMTVNHAYRREGLTVATLAADLGMGEAALRSF